jgi:hypothetical protein
MESCQELEAQLELLLLTVHLLKPAAMDVHLMALVVVSLAIFLEMLILVAMRAPHLGQAPLVLILLCPC